MSDSFSFGSFNWFFGEVVDINAPKEHYGKVRVKIFGYHTEETSNLQTEDIQWATVGSGTDSASNKGVGTLPHSLIDGSQVFGFFVDGKVAQTPFIICSFPSNTDGVSDLSKLSTGTNTIKNVKEEYEPESPYNAVYPNNVVRTTTSGHIIEIDDTPQHERIHVRHKSGSYYQFYPDGTVVKKSVKDNHSITIGDDYVQVNGNVKEKIKGNYTLEVMGNYSVNVQGKTTLSTGKQLMVNSGASTNIVSGASINLTASGQMKMTGAVIYLN